MLVEFTLAGAPFVALNGGPGMTHGPACSITVAADSQDESDTIWQGHVAAGGTPQRCGWLTDAFGVSWQIFPAEMRRYLFDGTRDARHRAYQAMLGMTRIDLAGLRAAHEKGK